MVIFTAELYCEKLEGSGKWLILLDEIFIYLFKNISSIEFNPHKQ